MKKNTFPWLSFAMHGTGIGFPVTILCMTLIGGFNALTLELLTWMMASALFGIISGLIFYRSNLNLPVAIAVHCACCLAVTTAAGAICGYADNIRELLKGILPVFVLVYVLVYVLCYFLMKSEEKRVNQLLSKK